MSVTFTKLFSSITESTLWCEPDRVRIVWIAMLAMADSRGRVWASLPGLANRARVPLADAEDAIQRFLSPDKHSRTADNEGRRIEPIDGGWRLLNHEKYRNIRDEEAIKESKRAYINARRAKERAAVESVDICRTSSNSVVRGRHNAEAYTEAEAEARKTKTARKRASPPALVSVDDMVAEGVDRQHATDWLLNRKTKDLAPLTPTIWAQTKGEAAKAGLSPGDAVKAAASEGWGGFKASWLKDGRSAGLNKQEALEERNRAVGSSWAEKMKAQNEN